MKKSSFKAVAGNGGFVRTTLAPLNDRSDSRFTMMDMTMLVLLVFGSLAIARFLVGH